MNIFQDIFRDYEVDVKHGFLPDVDPSVALPEKFRIFDEVGTALPVFLRDGTLESTIQDIPIFETGDVAELAFEHARLLMVRLSFLAPAYVWEHWKDGRVRDHLPANIAAPLRSVAHRFGLPPLLCYSSYALWNWQRKDSNEPIMPENIKLIQNFLGGESEEWFVAIHVAIEEVAAPLLLACWYVGDALREDDAEFLVACLRDISNSLGEINALMRRMPEHCDYYEYFTFVRPYLYGWKNKEIFPNGMMYKGKISGEDEHLVFPGETGAQSGIFPSLDRVLGVRHSPGPLSEHLHEMLHVCTPLKQRNFVLELEKRPALCEEKSHLYGKEARLLYEECRALMREFRAIHYGYAEKYIQQQASGISGNLGYLGTRGSGGTPFIPSLAKHLKET